MKIKLQELLEQKSNLEKHLHWLNSKINQLELECDDSDIKLDTISDSHTNDNKDQNDVESMHRSENQLEKTVEPSDDIFISQTQNIQQQTKQGCLWTIIIATLLLLTVSYLVYTFWPEWDDDKIQKYKEKNAKQKQSQKY